MSIPDNIGERIRCRREELGYSLEDLAEMANLSAVSLEAVELGKRRIGDEDLRTIAGILLLTVEFLRSGFDEPADALVRFAEFQYQDSGERQDFLEFARKERDRPNAKYRRAQNYRDGIPTLEELWAMKNLYSVHKRLKLDNRDEPS